MKQLLSFFLFYCLLSFTAHATSPCAECDTLVLKDMSHITVKIRSLTRDRLTYLPCNDAKATLMFYTRDEVANIIYRNGKRNPWGNVSQNKTYTGCSPKLDVVSAFSLLFALLGLGPMAIILGLIGYNTTKFNPNEWYGKDYAMAGMILGVVMTILDIILFTMIF